MWRPVAWWNGLGRQKRTGWLIIAVNTERSAAKTTLNIEGLADAQLRIFGSARKSASSGGKITDELAPLEAKVYTAGISP